VNNRTDALHHAQSVARVLLRQSINFSFISASSECSATLRWKTTARSDRRRMIVLSTLARSCWHLGILACMQEDRVNWEWSIVGRQTDRQTQVCSSLSVLLTYTAFAPETPTRRAVSVCAQTRLTLTSVGSDQLAHPTRVNKNNNNNCYYSSL